MRIGPIIIERVSTRTEDRAAYAQRMRCDDAFWAGLELPEGFVYSPATAPSPDLEPWVLELRRKLKPMTEAEIADAVARVDRYAGSISIGRPPRRSDWRCRGRYNEGDCADA